MPLNIEDYAIIGDCETAALVGRDRSIDWLLATFRFFCLFRQSPRHKGQRAMVDRAGRPGVKMARNYRGHSLILETTIETTDGVAVVTDFMPTRMRGAHLIRRVRGVRCVPSLLCASVMARSCRGCAAATMEVCKRSRGPTAWSYAHPTLT